MFATPENSDKIIRSLLRKQSIWSRYGRRKVFCNGFIAIGPIRLWWWLLEIWTLVVGIFFISEYKDFPEGLFFGGVAIFVFCIVSCAIISFGNPGIVPKPEFESALKNAYEVVHMIDNEATPPHRKVTVNGKAVKYTYCMNCHHFRPPGTSHCHTCDSCIEGWDHHCPVYGGCVGKKNLLPFHVMCLTQPLLWVYWLGCSTYAASSRASENQTVTQIILSSKTLLGVGITFLGAIVCPFILGSEKCEEQICEPKQKDVVLPLWETKERKSSGGGDRRILPMEFRDITIKGQTFSEDSMSTTSAYDSDPSSHSTKSISKSILENNEPSREDN